jgi:metallo-beta-lactamase family protein
MSASITLTSYGAARTTTGSRHLITVNGQQVLLDCGLYQGRRQEAHERNLNFGFSPKSLQSVVLSHAHIDHSGDLPNLTKQGYRGPVYCTPATADLCRVMLRDSAHIQESDAEWLNRRGKKRRDRDQEHGHSHTPAIEPLYTMEDAEVCIKSMETVHYHRPFAAAPGVEAEFINAGHILGSASVALSITGVGERPYRLGFTGDLGRAGLPLIYDPETLENLDWLLMESTYGARTHDPIGEAREELRSTIARVAARGGKVIVPSFAVERTQEIVYYLNDLYNSGTLPPIPIYVDSPLALNVTDIFRLHPECFNESTRKILEYDSDIFGFDRLTYIRTVDQSKALNNISVPCVIISASGMCEAGRILHHLKNSISNPRNCILFVGYQAEGTLGRKIVERQREVNIFGEPHLLKAEVVTLNTMSAHADKNELFAYAQRVKAASPNLKGVYLVHGENEGLEALGGRLRQELGLSVTIVEPRTTMALVGD